MNPQEAQLRAKLSDLEARFGRATLGTAACRQELGALLHELGSLPEAEAHLVAAYESFVRLSGATHPFTLTCLNNLALVLRDQGEVVEAEEILTVVAGRREALLGRTHLLTLNARYNLIGVRARRGDVDAVEQYGTLLTDCESMWEPDHPNVEAIRAGLLGLLWRTGRHAEAGRVVQRVSQPLPLPDVLRRCAQLLRELGMCPVSLTASRYGAGLLLGRHPRARSDIPAGELLDDSDLRTPTSMPSNERCTPTRWRISPAMATPTPASAPCC